MGLYNLRFDSVETPRELAQLADFMRVNHGSYNPEKHSQWIDEVNMPALEQGNTRRAFAWWEQGLMVGDAVLKIVDCDVVELKNFRVAPSRGLQGVGLGKTMLTIAERESVRLLTDAGAISPQTNSIQLVLDTTTGSAAEYFFVHHGFKTQKQAELYTPGINETIMTRQITLE